MKDVCVRCNTAQLWTREHHQADSGGAPLARTGLIDHIGLRVPDLVAANKYYDDFMSVLGLREWFETRPGGQLNYGPSGAHGLWNCSSTKQKKNRHRFPGALVSPCSELRETRDNLRRMRARQAGPSVECVRSAATRTRSL